MPDPTSPNQDPAATVAQSTQFAGATPISSESVSGVTIDRELERAFAIFTSPSPENIESEWQLAFSTLHSRHHEPEVALRLTEIMMTAPDWGASENAKRALHGTEDQRGITHLNAWTLLIATELLGAYEAGSRIHQELVADLKKYRGHPLVAAAMVNKITNGSESGSFAAAALEGTTDRVTLALIKEILADAVEGKLRAQKASDAACYALQVLKGSPDAEVQALIVRVFRDCADIDLRVSAARALGTINTAEARTLLVNSIFEPNIYWFVREGVSEALRDTGDNAISSKLLPLVDGSIAKTAWRMAGEQSNTTLSRFGIFLTLMTSQKESVYDLRIQVGMILQDRHPDIVERVLDHALMREPYRLTYLSGDWNFCSSLSASIALRKLSAVAHGFREH